jgi:hypothetical protein
LPCYEQFDDDVNPYPTFCTINSSDLIFKHSIIESGYD